MYYFTEKNFSQLKQHTVQSRENNTKLQHIVKLYSIKSIYIFSEILNCISLVSVTMWSSFGEI